MRKKFVRGAAVIAMVPPLLIGSLEPAPARDHGRGAAAIGGIIVGGAIASALSPKKKVIEKVYVPVAAPPPPPPAPTFSPAAGVLCYSAQRACYTAGGYDPRWTWQVYAN